MRIAELELDEVFQDCFIRGAGPVIECECGREHVAINSEYFDAEDEGMVAEYIERAETNDKLVLHYDCDAIGQISLAGRMWAETCECNGWKPYMEFIVSNRSQIKDFLIQIADKAQIALEHEKTFNVLKDKKNDVLDSYLH